MPHEEQTRSEGDLVADETTTEYHAVAGTSLEDCVFLGSRRADGALFRDFGDESWVLRHEPSGDGFDGYLEYGANSMLTGVFRAPTGEVFVSGRHLLVNHEPARPNSAWVRQELEPDTPTRGVFGFSADCVFTWGESVEDDRAPTSRLYQFNGRVWRELPAPKFAIVALHGLGPDYLVATSRIGIVGTYSSGRWTYLKIPTAQPLTAVFVCSPSEAYAVGHWGDIFEGSEFGWGKIGQSPRDPLGYNVALYDVARWRGELWVAAGVAGLLRRDGVTDRFDVVEPFVGATALDARERLLIAEQTRLTETEDGAMFVSTPPFELADARRDVPLGNL